MEEAAARFKFIVAGAAFRSQRARMMGHSATPAREGRHPTPGCRDGPRDGVQQIAIELR